MDTTGKRLRALRKEQGYTLEQVGEKLGTTKVTISRYETDVRVPSSEPMSKLAKLFNVSTDYLYCFTDERIHLTKEAHRDIDIHMNEILKEFSKKDAFSLSGDPICQEALESLRDAIEIGLTLAKKKQLESKNNK